MKLRRLFPVLIAMLSVILTLATTSAQTQAAPNGGVVGDGTLASCTDAALATALSGGGTVTFNCGGPATVTMTFKTISANTTIDGGGIITLTTSSSGVQQLFSLSSGLGLTLTNLTIANVPGASYASSIVNAGRLVLSATQVISTYYLINNTVASSTANVVNSTFISNTGVTLSSNGSFTVTNSQFLRNAPGGSGLLVANSGLGVVDNSDFISNTYSVLYNSNGVVAVTHSRFQQNATGSTALIPNYGTLAVDNSDFISNTTGSTLYTTKALSVSNSRFYWNRGGTASAIYMYGFSSSPALTLTNSSFMSNTASGGAIYNYYNGPAYISNTQFISNTSTNSAGALYLDYPGAVQVLSSTFQLGMGGGIYVNGSANPLIIADSQFISNTSQNSAGAIDAGTLTVTHSSFISNTSYNGSGAIDASRQAYITGSTFLTNTGTWGGAMELSSGGVGCPCFDVVANSIIKGNTSTSQGGGGIRATQYLTLINSEVSNNTVMGNSYGGGIYFASGYVLTVTNSVIQNNIVTGTSGSGGGVYLWGQGGYITGSTILSNSAGSGGGVYQNNGPLQIANTLVQSNTATTFFGGGLESHTDSLTLIDVNVSGNHTVGGGGQGYGAGLYVASFANPLRVNRSLFYNNVASHASSQGGGIYLTSPALITNTTIYSNSAGNGGNGFNYNSSYVITLTNNTILSNTNASGVITGQINNTGTAYRLTLINTIIGGCTGNKILSLGHNLSSDASCAITTTGDLSNTNPLLGAFANNGGFTQSFVPSITSPAVNAGDNAVCPGDDQRGVLRPIGSACDIGSIESPHKTPQSITFGALANRVVNDPPFIITATASSGLPVAFNFSGVCSVSGSTVTLSGVAGTCTITATQSGDATYAPASDVARAFAVTLVPQTISFAAIAHHPASDPPFAITATASSGLSVTFTALTSSTCAVTGTLVTPISGGVCTLRAAQGGNATYAAAPNVDRSFNVQYLQLIFFNPLPSKVLGDAPFALTAQAGSALPVSYASLTTNVCTVSGITVTLVSGGQCTIRASQAGNAEFAPAPDVDQSFTVLLPQTITFPQPADHLISNGAFVVTATASSGLTVTFSSQTTGVCTVNIFGLVTPISAGVCTVRAAQTGNSVYA
ncbi:MAG: right-handed parallel beta-helix repeat-containing protein, partial [Thermoflexales bacterium]|nr:right-handed parallel beta-helix repeat-containing protein [Thermoflexales bacterium]